MACCPRAVTKRQQGVNATARTKTHQRTGRYPSRRYPAVSTKPAQFRSGDEATPKPCGKPSPKPWGPAHPRRFRTPPALVIRGQLPASYQPSALLRRAVWRLPKPSRGVLRGVFPSPPEPALLLRCWLVSDRVSAQTVLIGWRCLPLERLTNGVVPVCTVSILPWPQGKGELPSKAVDALGPARSQSHHDSKGHFCAAEQFRPRPTARAAR